MKEESTGIAERLKIYIHKRYGSVYKLAQKSGIPQTTLQYIVGKSHKKPPSSDILAKIKSLDPSLDLNWLITGQYTDTPSATIVVSEPYNNYSKSDSLDDLTRVLIRNQIELIQVLKDCLDKKSEKEKV